MICTAPDYSIPGDAPTLFLAGGITNCPDWQSEAIEMLAETDITIFNPRRPDFPMDDPSAAREQIKWEHFYLRMANVVLFWFCAQETQPIALYELGAWSMTTKPIAVGTDPDYPRRQDVLIQTELARPTAYVFDDLTHTIGAAVAATAQFILES